MSVVVGKSLQKSCPEIRFSPTFSMVFAFMSGTRNLQFLSTRTIVVYKFMLNTSSLFLRQHFSFENLFRLCTLVTCVTLNRRIVTQFQESQSWLFHQILYLGCIQRRSTFTGTNVNAFIPFFSMLILWIITISGVMSLNPSQIRKNPIQVQYYDH